jgi:hypothetical protein
MMLSAGRSGTQKLAEIMKTVPGVYAEHEGSPGFDTVRLFNQKDMSVGYDFLKERLKFWNSLPEQTIVHTGHMAGLGFFEHFAALRQPFSAIILRRPRREVAKSMWALKWIPGKNEYIRPWYSGPDEPGVLPFPGWETAHPYQLCYWWVLDSERRIRQLRPLCDKTVETTLTDILNPTGFNLLTNQFGLPAIDSVDQEWINHNSTPQPEFPDEYAAQLEQEVIDRCCTLQMIDVDGAHTVTPNVAINTIKSLAFSMRKSEDQLTGYIKPLIMEI